MQQLAPETMDPSVALATIPFSSELAPAALDPVTVYLRGRQSNRSRETMREAMKRLSTIPEIKQNGGVTQIVWGNFTFAHANAIRASLIQAIDENDEPLYGPATINVTLCGLRGVLKTAYHLGILSFEGWHRAAEGLKSVKGTRLPPGRALSDEEIARLRTYCNALEGIYGAMTRGMVAVLLGGGVRRLELCTMRLEKYHRPCVDVIGKGNKERRVTLSEDAIADLEAWIEIRKTFETSSPWMFLRVSKDQKVHPHPFSLDVVYHFVGTLGANAGIGKLATHDFRRTCATRQLDRGVDLRLVQQNLGHEDPKTTAKYDLRTEREIKRAIDKAGVY